MYYSFKYIRFHQEGNKVINSVDNSLKVVLILGVFRKGDLIQIYNPSGLSLGFNCTFRGQGAGLPR